MSGFASPYGQPATAWQEHHTPDGRAYYYNSTTKVTQWTKPEDMMSPAERALANQPWKEYTAEGGRKYWYNTETKKSSWEEPEVYKNALGGPPDIPNAPRGPSGGGYSNHYDSSRDRDHRDRDYRDRDTYHESRQISYPTDPTAQAFIPASNDPEYSTPEEAEAAFVKLLRRGGVQPDWTWTQAIRATCKDPQFRAIKDPKDRRDAFDKYCQDMIVQDKERAKERLAKLRADFETMLKRHPDIVYYTRWKTARPMIEGETIFRSTNDEAERRQLFEEYVIGLKKAHADHETTQRKTAMDGLTDILHKLDLEPYTRWHDAKTIISSTQPFQNDDKYQSLTQLDILTAFQNHMKSLERAFNDAKQEEKNQKYRRERKRRDAFKELLRELHKDGKINAGSKWTNIFPLLENDPRYRDMAGQPGSTGQELFWDMVEDEERALRGPRNDVVDVMTDKRFGLTPSSDFESFLPLMKEDRRTANIDRETLKIIFDRLREKSKKDEDRQPDRHQRRAIEDLRSYIKRLEPPIASGDTYDKVRPRLMKADEFQAVSSEEFRRSAFDKHMRRLREREDEAERLHRRRERSPDRDSRRGGDRERDRSRGERTHRGNGRSSRRSRSPEPDAYEADRRKAIAERERNHRKSTMAENLLSSDRGRLSPPPRREREREPRDRERERDRERDRDYDRRSSRRDDDSHYDRERRDRDEERERLYRRRVDRGDSHDELNYGDDKSTSSRRRRPEDDDDYTRKDTRDSKRVKRDRSREHTPRSDGRARKSPPPPAAPAPRDIRSGSEEGEIEEEE